MGKLADAIAEEFKKKGIPLPGRVYDDKDENGVIRSGGGVRVPMMMMDAAPTDERTAEQCVEDRLMHLEKTGVLRHENGQMIVASSGLGGGAVVSTADAVIAAAHAIRDKAYADYMRSISPGGSWADRSELTTIEDARAMSDRAYDAYVAGLNKAPGQAIKLVDKVPEIVPAADRPDFMRAVADAESDDETRARAGIEQLLSVARTCRARALAATSGEESRNAEAAASYIEALASAAELVLTGKNAANNPSM